MRYQARFFVWPGGWRRRFALLPRERFKPNHRLFIDSRIPCDTGRASLSGPAPGSTYDRTIAISRTSENNLPPGQSSTAPAARRYFFPCISGNRPIFSETMETLNT